MSSLNNATGNEMSYSYFHVPVWYSGIRDVGKNGQSRELVVMEITKNNVVYSHKSDVSCRVGIMKRTKLLNDKSGSYFIYRGKKVHFTRSGWVL